MKRVLAAALLAAAAFGTTPVSATPLGDCKGTVDTACRAGTRCERDSPCMAIVCVVWLKGQCHMAIT